MRLAFATAAMLLCSVVQTATAGIQINEIYFSPEDQKTTASSLS